MFGPKKLSDEDAGIIKEIQEGERRKPKHNRPKSVRDSGLDSFVTPAHEVVFEDFDWFAAVLNYTVSDPWAVEETPRTEIRDIMTDGPYLGRTYKVYYNSLLMGDLQVTRGIDLQNQHKFSGIIPTMEEALKHRYAEVIIELHYMRWVPYADALSLIVSLERLLGPSHDQKADGDRASVAAVAALTAYLWESASVEDVVMSFDHRIDGPYEGLRIYTEHWQKEGFDPFERWGGDRPT